MMSKIEAVSIVCLSYQFHITNTVAYGLCRGDSVGDSAKVTDGPDAFKVDVRVVRDIFSARQGKKESDTGNGELSRKGASVGKITDDKVKLLVESKCVLDRIIATLETERPVVVPALQLKGM